MKKIVLFALAMFFSVPVFAQVSQPGLQTQGAVTAGHCTEFVSRYFVQDAGAPCGGTGDVVGPASSTDNAIVRFDGTSGKLVQNSSPVIDDSGNIAITTGNGYFNKSGGGQFVYIGGPDASHAGALSGTNAFRVGVNTYIGWTGGSAGAAPDLQLFRDAANILALRNGVNAQSMRIYNTFTDASNYERLSISWAANVATIAPRAAGTGTVRELAVVNASVQLIGSTVAALPTCNAGLIGQLRHVTDALAPTYLGALVGGGAVVAPVFCNGTAWVSD